jgi:hypothetical protein
MLEKKLILRSDYLCCSLIIKTVIKRQNDVKKKDGYGGGRLKKTAISDKSMSVMQALIF